MHSKVGDHVVFEVIESECVGDACTETCLRGKTHGVVITDVQLDEFLITTWQVHPQKMLAALGQWSVQHLGKSVYFLSQFVNVEIRRKRRMDTNIGIVAQAFNQRLESRFANGDVLVVGIVVAAKNEVYWLEFVLFLQFKLEIKRIERVFAFASQHLMAFTDTLTVSRGQILQETAHRAIQSLAFISPGRIHIVGRGKSKLRPFKVKIGIDGIQLVSQSQSPNVHQRFLKHAILEHPRRLGAKTAILVAHLRKVFFIARDEEKRCGKDIERQQITLSVDRIWRHRAFKLHRAKRLLVNMPFKKNVNGLHKRFSSKALHSIMQFGFFKSLELLGIGSQIVFNAQQLLEHQIEDIHHAACDLWNENQHFHRHKNRMIFNTKGKKAKNVATSPKQHRKVVPLSV